MVPEDQIHWLHGLDAFPKHPGVIALYRKVIAETPYDSVRDKVKVYLERVESGASTTGNEWS